MDPNATLADIKALIRDILNPTLPDRDKLAVAHNAALLMRDLDRWLSQGGFLPTAWEHKERKALD